MHHSLTPDGSLRLRTWSRRDTVLLHALVIGHGDELRTWLPWIDERQSLEAIDDFINQTQMALLSAQNHFYGIWHEGELVGELAHHETTKRNRSTSISYWLAAPYRGQGIVTRSLAALLHYLFREMEMNRVELRIAVGNTPSIAVAEKFGFAREGVLREAEWLYDRFVDHEIFSLLRAEWEAGPWTQ